MSFRPIARFITRYPALIIAGIIAITVGLGAGMLRLKLDTDLTDDIPSTIPEKAFYDQVGKIFPSDDFLLIALTNSKGVFTPEVLSQVKDWSDRIELLPGVKSVLSLSSASLIKGTEGGITIEPAMPEIPETPEALEAFKATILSNDLTKTLIGKDGKSTALIITLKENLDTTPVPRFIVQVPANQKDPVLAALKNTANVQNVYSGETAEERFDLAAIYATNLQNIAKKRQVALLAVPVQDANLAELKTQLEKLVADSTGKAGSLKLVSGGIPFYDRISQTLPLFQNNTDGKLYISGSRAVSGIVTRLLVQDLSMLFPIVILIIIGVLYLSFRSVRGGASPLGKRDYLGYLGHGAHGLARPGNFQCHHGTAYYPHRRRDRLYDPCHQPVLRGTGEN